MNPNGKSRKERVWILAACSLVYLALAAPSLAAGIPYGNNPAAGHYVDVRGIRMYVEEYGSGPAVLMLHGNGGSMSAFGGNAPYFSQKYHVILVDSRAQGKTVDPGPDLTFEMMADDFAALLDRLGVKSAYVIGFSDGGIDALELAMRHPNKVIALAATGANLWEAADAYADGLWAGTEAQYRRDHAKVWKTEKERNDWKIFMLDYTQPRIALSDLRAIRCPCLIICGDHDMISITHTVQIYQAIPKANLWVVPDSGHATLAEHPDAFNATVDGFFSKPFHARK
ncbi:MAG TPA: alpha/beta hydrolase [Opitutaceae bacterium]|jgi:pimeloyl-ACP methyl ester carboxylesterase